ncbi:glycosyltransferase family 39 protein [Actinospica sp. MGRD01-02]|uniref:Glycosyltransferase family 39 protein n=1 Tax=Actinospica acidithermotolerans TaxID=2828514 RepID=A0A941IFE5_9ACTN|nr:glycosyltransferase family 39 protein [Actinospica acidithermotolerans]MBR7826245.1 glycosyltransferase family 39 protein [Actinospica acidithermotolerans]
MAQVSIAATLTNTAFVDEACYLFAGHTEWASLFGGAAPNMDYATFFSGSPYLYPLLGALANSVGGLTTARYLSLVFMLGATVMLYRATVLLFGRRAAIWGSSLFALCGPVLFMSHLATFDAPAVFLLATGFWFAVRSGTNKVFMLETTAVTTLAVAFKYTSLVYAVPIVLVAAICAIPSVGWRWAAARGAVLGMLMFLAGFALLCLAGPASVTGLMTTTLARPAATNTVHQVAHRSLVYVGFILALALLGSLWFVLRRRRSASKGNGPKAPVSDGFGWKSRLLLASVLTGAALIAPLGDMRLHTLTSLEKHAGYGLLFAAPMGGWLLDKLAGTAWWRVAPAVALVGALGGYGANQAHEFFGEWLTSTTYMKQLVAATAEYPSGSHILAEDPWVERYYLGHAGNRFTWSDTYGLSFTATNGKTLSGVDAYQAAISERYFSAVFIDYNATPGLDLALDQMLATNGYQRTSVPSYDRYGRTDVEIWTLIGART